MQAQANGHYGPNGSAAGRTGIRKKWRHSRSILKEGLEAALRTSPEVLENCKPKTNYGALVRGLVLEASKSKATPLKTVMALLAWDGEDDGDEDEADEAHRDWSPDGEWETMPEPEPKPSPARSEAREGAVAEDKPCPAREELRRRLNRLVEAGQHEQVARVFDAIRAGAEPEPVSTG